MRNPSPSFQFFPRDFLADPAVSVMSNAELGAYVRLICHAWNPPNRDDGTEVPIGHIPFERDLLAGLANVSQRGWEKISPKIGRALKHDPERNTAFSKRLVEEFERQEINRQNAADAGRKSGEARRQKTNGRSTVVRIPFAFGSNQKATPPPTETNSAVASAVASAAAAPDLEQDLTLSPSRAHVWTRSAMEKIWVEVLKKSPITSDHPCQERILVACADAAGRLGRASPEDACRGLLGAFREILVAMAGWAPHVSWQNFERYFASCEQVLTGERTAASFGDPGRTRHGEKPSGQTAVPRLNFTEKDRGDE